MIKHVVLLSWKKGVNAEQVAEVVAGFDALPKQIRQIKSYQHGADAGIYRGNADYALVAEFRNEKDLKAYVSHPAHQAFLTDATSEILESFQAIQFEFTPAG